MMQSNHHEQTPEPVDKALREALEPEGAAVRRLIHTALAETPRRSPIRHGWRLATAAAVLVVAVLTVPRFFEKPSAPVVESLATEPARLEISNENGPVTVRSTGAQIVFLPPRIGDPS